MTAQQLKDFVRATLIAQRSIAQEILSFDAVIDFITQSITTGIPSWTALLTFNADGTGDGAFTTHPDDNGNLRFWTSIGNGNVGHQPPTNPSVSEDAYWIEVSPSSGSAIKEWQPGVYGSGLVIVYWNGWLYLLTAPTRPYNSVNFDAELVTGDWQIINQQIEFYPSLSNFPSTGKRNILYISKGEAAPVVIADPGFDNPAGIWDNDSLVGNLWTPSGVNQSLKVLIAGDGLSQWVTQVLSSTYEVLSGAGLNILFNVYSRPQSGNSSARTSKVFVQLRLSGVVKESFEIPFTIPVSSSVTQIVSISEVIATTFQFDEISIRIENIAQAPDEGDNVEYHLGYAGNEITLDYSQVGEPIKFYLWTGATYTEAAGGGGLSKVIAEVYGTVAALIAEQVNQVEGYWYAVTDASTDPTVDSGWAIYEYLGTTNGDLTDYFKRQEQESIDVVLTNASETDKGIVEEGTDAEVAAGTVTGSTGAKLFVSAQKLITWWTAIKAAAQTITGFWTFGKVKTTHTAFGYTTLIDAANIAWNADTIGNIAQVTLGGNRTLDAITNPQIGAIYILRVVQDGTGGRTLTFNAAYQFNQTPSINAAASGRSHFMFYYNGTNFSHISDFMKLSKAGNTDYETLGDSSNVYRFAMLSRLGAVFKTLGLEWDESLGQFRFSGSTAIIRAGSSVGSGNFYIKVIEAALNGFDIIDDNGSYLRFGIDTDGRRKMFASVPIKRLRGTSYLEDGFISQQVEASSTTTLRTIPTQTDSIITVSIEAISVMNEDKNFIIGRAIFNFKNSTGVVTDISLTAFKYDEQYSSIKATDGYVTGSDTRIDCVVSGTDVLINFYNTEAKIVTVQFDVDYTVTPLPTA